VTKYSTEHTWYSVTGFISRISDIPECTLVQFELFSQTTDLQCRQYPRLVVNSLDNAPVSKSTT